MAGRTKEAVMMRPDGSHAIPIRVSDYSPNDADREWVARELGDVPHDRIVGLNAHDNPMSWAEFRCVVPIESLGR